MTLETADLDAVLAAVRASEEAGARLEDLAANLDLSTETVLAALRTLTAKGLLLPVSHASLTEDRWLDPRAYRQVRDDLLAALQAFAAQNPDTPGMPRGMLIQQAVPVRGQALGPIFLHWLEKEKAVLVEGDQIRLPGKGGRPAAESDLARRIVEAYDRGGLAPPSPGEVRQALGVKRGILDGVMADLVERGRLVRLPGDLVLSAAAFETLARDLQTLGWKSFTVGQFKDHFGLSRKWAIPLLEEMDARGLTRREGNHRFIVRE